ncbi:MAG: adenosylhomocysteinase [Christensenellaceae bacterium]|nr:adenosylhomocysteinase [Christensenellaceae bacterium]MEA5069228.1 adenosylhomocysteinase [Christensenellaceae bacterium]
MKSVVRDASLAPEGARKIEWAREHMPILAEIERQFERERPFEGLDLAMSIHLEAKTARAALLFKAGGARVFATGCNPLSTQDDVAAALSTMGVTVNAWHGATAEEYHRHLIDTLRCAPHVIVDDGGDLTQILCDERPELARNLIGGGEETTTGVMRLRARAAAGALPFPMISVNDAQMKYLFDNRYGTGQSVTDGILRTTNLVVAGKRVVVAGYGWCGKGVALRMKGMGARVAVCEIDPVRAVEAAMDGHDVMTMDEAAAVGDVFITVTGCKDVITLEHMLRMKPGAVMCNAGHFDVEVDVKGLRQMARRTWTARHNIEGFELTDGRALYLLAEGRLVNLAAGDGHPAEIMDISFALQALSAEYLVKSRGTLEPGVHEVPSTVDLKVARMKLSALGLTIDRLSEEQAAYIRAANG